MESGQIHRHDYIKNLDPGQTHDGTTVSLSLKEETEDGGSQIQSLHIEVATTHGATEARIFEVRVY